MKKQTKEQKEKKSFLSRLKQFAFSEKSIIASAILSVIIVVGIVLAYLLCNDIVKTRAFAQLDDAANTVIDQVNSKFQSDSNVLNATAEILAASDIYVGDEIDADKMQRALNSIEPIQQTLRLRVLLPTDEIILPDGDMVYSQFDYEGEVSHGEHISKRIESQRADADKAQIIAHFVPIKGKNDETVAMLYGVTVLSELPDDMRVSNIYNSEASVLIVDVSDGSIIMDTWHGRKEDGTYNKDLVLGTFKDFSLPEVRGSSTTNLRDDILGLNEAVVAIKAEGTGQWVYFCYKPASGVVEKQWSIAVIIPESVAFVGVGQVNTVFIVIGVIYLVALTAYFLWVRHSAKAEVAQSVEHAVLTERLHKAEAAERAKSTFLSNMSHDIRTPMNAILGFTTLAETNIDNKERVQDYLKKIMSSGNHLLSLINDILDMSRIESGKLNIEEKPCSISDIFRDMRNIIQTQMKGKQLNFFMDTLDVVDEDIFCDKLHLNQVLLNLLSNAIKFTPAGGSISLTIKQKMTAPTGYGAYEIHVKDTGIGMSQEFAKHIFEPFERERTSTVSGIQGTGLGMAITKNIVDTMGGTIELQTEKGKGTEFVINLQFRLQTEHKHVEKISELEGLRALVVDDNFDTCDSVSKMLVQIGMRSEWTMFGKEAVLRAQQAVEMGNPFAVYIIDWVMPDLSGFEIVRQIRKVVGDDVPIIIITAYDVTAVMDEAKDIGVTAYCNKPIFLSELRDTLISAVGRPVENAEATDASSVRETEEFVGKRLLLVEDNELNREIAQELLEECGFAIDTAEDGSVAVEKVKNSPHGYYDLLLMDVQMPVMDGYEATRQIRALPAEKLAGIPIVAMTANAFDEDRKKAAECGMDAHVAKPINVPQLLQVLKILLEKNN